MIHMWMKIDDDDSIVSKYSKNKKEQVFCNLYEKSQYVDG